MGLEGITVTVDGKEVPIEEYINDQENIERTSEVNKVFCDTVKEAGLAKLRKVFKVKHHTRNGRDGRVRLLTEKQIRKEYETMRKDRGGKTRMETVIGALYETKSSMTALEISKHLNYPMPNVSSIMSALTKALPDVFDVIRTKPFRFKFVAEADRFDNIHQILEAYKACKSAALKKMRVNVAGALDGIKASSISARVEFFDNTKYLDRMEKLLVEIFLDPDTSLKIEQEAELKVLAREIIKRRMT